MIASSDGHRNVFHGNRDLLVEEFGISVDRGSYFEL